MPSQIIALRCLRKPGRDVMDDDKKTETAKPLVVQMMDAVMDSAAALAKSVIEPTAAMAMQVEDSGVGKTVAALVTKARKATSRKKSAKKAPAKKRAAAKKTGVKKAALR